MVYKFFFRLEVVFKFRNVILWVDKILKYILRSIFSVIFFLED